MTYCYAYRNTYGPNTRNMKDGKHIGWLYRFTSYEERKAFLDVFDDAEAVSRYEARYREPNAFNRNALDYGVIHWVFEGQEPYPSAECAR